MLIGDILVHNILPQDGEAFYYPDFFSKIESTHLFKSLSEKINWKQSPIKMFGKEILQPRLTAWYGEPGVMYTYSGLSMDAQEWNQDLLAIKFQIEKVALITFNGVLLNRYRNEKDSMGWHRDNEKELGKNPIIGSVSFGEPRVFELRHAENKKLKVSIELEHGSLLIMRGETQHYWQHRLPKKSKECGERINLTFRAVF